MPNLGGLVLLAVAGGIPLAACVDGSGGFSDPTPPHTHHGVLYGIVLDQASDPVAGASVALALSNEPNCFGPEDIEIIDQTEATGPTGAYRIHFELALPDPVPSCVTLLLAALHPVSTDFTIDTVGFGGLITAPLDSVRHDPVLHPAPAGP